MTRAPSNWAGGAAHPPEGEEEELDVPPPEQALELALAYLCELRQVRMTAHDAALVQRASFYIQRAHRLIFRARWEAA